MHYIKPIVKYNALFYKCQSYRITSIIFLLMLDKSSDKVINCSVD